MTHPNNSERVLVAMSGGVDSSVAALLLQEEGFDVVGVFMRNGVEGAETASKRSCCSASDSRDAALVADRLGIPFYSVDYSAEFSKLIDRFVEEYRRGRTPNPCVLCNQDLKFGHLFSLADDLGAGVVATGHYARAEEGRLMCARDEDKDQTYYLFGVDRKALPRILFPLGSLTTAEVRDHARRAGLTTADKDESMEICFAPSGDYRDVLARRGGGGKPGVFVDEEGSILGEHDGVDGFTIGQRRGLPAMGSPRYVKEIDSESGQVVVCSRSGLLKTVATVREINWLVGTPVDAAQVKIRARSPAVPATFEPLATDPDRGMRITFDEPIAAITPGQAAVFYDGDRVLGGGWIS